MSVLILKTESDESCFAHVHIHVKVRLSFLSPPPPPPPSSSSSSCYRWYSDIIPHCKWRHFSSTAIWHKSHHFTFSRRHTPICSAVAVCIYCVVAASTGLSAFIWTAVCRRRTCVRDSCWSTFEAAPPPSFTRWDWLTNKPMAAIAISRKKNNLYFIDSLTSSGWWLCIRECCWLRNLERLDIGKWRCCHRKTCE